jgi:hypothetical protein
MAEINQLTLDRVPRLKLSLCAQCSSTLSRPAKTHRLCLAQLVHRAGLVSRVQLSVGVEAGVDPSPPQRTMHLSGQRVDGARTPESN